MRMPHTPPSCQRPHGQKRPREDESKELRALRSFQVRMASRCREALVNQWREVSRPRRAGAVPRMPRGTRLDFPALFQEWLEVRGLGDALEHVEDRKGWAIYKYKREPVVSVEDSWETAFHGTWWYSVWLVLQSGVLLESNDWGKGHDFWEPGVYCSPNLDTARWYARPQVLFGDGVYHRIIFELRVNPVQRKRSRQRGGVQWVFPTGAVALVAVRVQLNAPPVNGEERVNGWDADLEALPPNCSKPEPTINSREGPWPEVEGDEDGEGEEECSLPPHLAGANSIRPSCFRRLQLPPSGDWEGSIRPPTADLSWSGGRAVGTRPLRVPGPIRPAATNIPAWALPGAELQMHGSARLATASQEASEQPCDSAATPLGGADAMQAWARADAAAVHATLARMRALMGESTAEDPPESRPLPEGELAAWPSGKT